MPCGAFFGLFVVLVSPFRGILSPFGSVRRPVVSVAKVGRIFRQKSSVSCLKLRLICVFRSEKYTSSVARSG